MKSRVLRAALSIIGGVGVLVGLQFVNAYHPNLLDHPIALWEGPAGTTIFRDPLKGWGLMFPRTWQGQLIYKRGYRRVYGVEMSGVVVSNSASAVGPPRVRWNGATPIVDLKGQPSDLVAIQVLYKWTGGFRGTCATQPFPLSLANADRSTTSPSAGGTSFAKLELGFVGNHEPYSATAWTGSDASKADLAALEDIVRTISFDDVPERPISCSNRAR